MRTLYIQALGLVCLTVHAARSLQADKNAWNKRATLATTVVDVDEGACSSQSNSSSLPSSSPQSIIINRSLCNTTTPRNTTVLLNGTSNSGYYTNDVSLDLTRLSGGYELIAAQYTVRDLSITDGQDPLSFNQIGEIRIWKNSFSSISFYVGRRGSRQVADFWKSNFKSSESTFNHDPDRLNFAFLGTLTLNLTGGVLEEHEDTYTIDDVGIAQGSSLLSNNWWFGGKNGVYVDGNNVRLSGRSTSGFSVNFYFRRGGFGNSPNVIQLTQIEYPSYKLYSLLNTFRGENVADTWQSLHKGYGKVPPFVTYYDRSRAAALKLTVLNGELWDTTGRRFDTSFADEDPRGSPVAIFALDAEGTLFASNQHKKFMFHHSSMVAGGSVASVGGLTAEKGYITSMSCYSGHYRPDRAVATMQVTEALYRQGYTREIPNVEGVGNASNLTGVMSNLTLLS